MNKKWIDSVKWVENSLDIIAGPVSQVWKTLTACGFLPHLQIADIFLVLPSLLRRRSGIGHRRWEWGELQPYLRTWARFHKWQKQPRTMQLLRRNGSHSVSLVLVAKMDGPEKSHPDTANLNGLSPCGWELDICGTVTACHLLVSVLHCNCKDVSCDSAGQVVYFLN